MVSPEENDGEPLNYNPVGYRQPTNFPKHNDATALIYEQNEVDKDDESLEGNESEGSEQEEVVESVEKKKR